MPGQIGEQVKGDGDDFLCMFILGLKKERGSADIHAFRGLYEKGALSAVIETVKASVAAVDDFIGHDPTMGDDFSDMLKFDFVETLQDAQIYNCFVKDGRSNPHKLYGFLVHPTTAGVIARWIE